MEQWNNDGGTEEQTWWNSGTVMMDQWTNDRETVEQLWWNKDGGKGEQI